MSGLPIVASVERCGWELPAWTLRGEATFELGAAAFDVRVLEADEVDEDLEEDERRPVVEQRLSFDHMPELRLRT